MSGFSYWVPVEAGSAEALAQAFARMRADAAAELEAGMGDRAALSGLEPWCRRMAEDREQQDLSLGRWRLGGHPMGRGTYLRTLARMFGRAGLLSARLAMMPQEGEPGGGPNEFDVTAWLASVPGPPVRPEREALAALFVAWVGMAGRDSEMAGRILREGMRRWMPWELDSFGKWVAHPFFPAVEGEELG